ncbi:MAG: hypothetical protein ACPGMR_07790 [Pontibacterium sp.]
MTYPIEFWLALSLPVILLILCYRDRTGQQAGLYERGVSQLSALVRLTQMLQRHRGMCANPEKRDSDARRQLIIQIESLAKKTFADANYLGTGEVSALFSRRWSEIKGKPENSFVLHCVLIESTLAELVTIADESGLTADFDSKDKGDIWTHLTVRPQYTECLARIRGLGSRAANLGTCPLGLKVQLQYLSKQVADSTVLNAGGRGLVAKVKSELIDPEVIHVSGDDFFDHVTELIDKEVNHTQQFLRTL